MSQDTTIDVVFAINGYTVTVNATTGQGSFDNVAQNNTYAVEHGDNQTINIAADSVNGYHIASITCGSDEVVLGNNTDLTYAYTINNIVSDTTVEVEFALNEYPITVTLVGSGSVAPATQDWEYGDDATFVIEPAEECYYIDSIIVDGSEAVITNVQGMSFTIANVVEPHTLHVVFADSVFQMTKRIYYPYMGTVSEGEAHCGGSYDYEIHANEGYHISSISLDYATEPAIDSLRIADSVVTVTDIHANHHMIVDFALNTYDVTVSANEFGTITPDGDLTPSHGDVLTFTLAAMNPCHELVTSACYGTCLRLKAFDCTVLFSDHVLAGFDFIKYYLEQEAVLGVACYFVAFHLAELFQGQFGLGSGPARCAVSFNFQVFAGRLVLDHEGKGTFRLFLRHTAGNRLREGQLAGRDLLVIVLQIDLDLATCAELITSAGYRCCLCFKAIDRTVLLGDRVLAGFDFIKYYLEQEAVLSVACYFVPFHLAELFQGQFCLSLSPARCAISFNIQVFTGCLVLDCEGKGTFRLFLRHASCHGLREGQLAGRDLLVDVVQVDLDLLRCL